MSLKLTPAMIEGAYEYLRTTPPFSRWKLPPGDQVEFVVSGTRKWQALYSAYKRKSASPIEHIVYVSATRCGHTDTLINLVAHEMIHVHQAQRGTETPNTQHNADFYRLTRVVCRHHGWDPENFTP